MSQIRLIATIALVLLLSGLAFAAPGEKPAQVIAPGQNDVDFQAAAGSLDSWCGAEVLAIVTAHGIGVESLVAGDFAAPESAQIRPMGASALEVSSEGFENRGGGVYRLGIKPVDGAWVAGQYQVGLRLDTGNGAKAEWAIVPITVSEIPSCFVQWRVEDGGNGHWYRLVRKNLLSWYDARDQAATLGGYLVTITSAEEQAFLEQRILPADFVYPSAPATVLMDGVAIGAMLDPNPGNPIEGWRWLTGEPWSYTHWYAGQPLEWPDTCASSWRNGQGGTPWNLTWDDWYCYETGMNLSFGFVLEQDSAPARSSGH